MLTYCILVNGREACIQNFTFNFQVFLHFLSFKIILSSEIKKGGRGLKDVIGLHAGQPRVIGGVIVLIPVGPLPIAAVPTFVVSLGYPDTILCDVIMLVPAAEPFADLALEVLAALIQPFKVILLLETYFIWDAAGFW